MAFAFIGLDADHGEPGEGRRRASCPRQPIGSLARRVSQAMARSAR